MAAAAPNVDILINGQEVPDSDLQSYVVNRDMFQPDEAAIVLSNHGDIYNDKWQPGATVEIKVGKGESVFKGELSGLEPRYQGGGKTTMLVRSYNKMHKLLGGRKSITFKDMSDKDIISKVAQEAGLSLEWKCEFNITHKHVYQHNLTDLEFIRMRAGRLGLHVWCVDAKLFVKEPDLSKTGAVKLSVALSGKGGSLRSFAPRLSTAGIVKKVTVKGWDPEKKEEIVGMAEASSSPLGSKNAASAAATMVKNQTFFVDQPIMSVEEANALAKARLREASLTYMTGEAEIAGNPKVELGEVIEIKANEKSTDRFNGKYYIAGVTHRHTLPKAEDGGYVTILRVMRDAEGG